MPAVADSLRHLTALASTAAAVALAVLFADAGVPWWVVVNSFIIVVFAALTALWRPEDLRRRRAAGGLCVYCGYDLTGNVSGVCPECGGAR